LNPNTKKPNNIHRSFIILSGEKGYGGKTFFKLDTCIIIFSRSNGAVAVRDTAPAHPPATRFFHQCLLSISSSSGVA